MARTKQIARNPIIQSADVNGENQDNSSIFDNRSNIDDDNSTGQDSSSQGDRNLATQEDHSFDSDSDKNGRLEGYLFTRRYLYKDSEYTDPIEYRQLLSEKIRLNESKDYERNCFFTDNGGGDLEWPHTTKPDVWMKSISPKTSNVDLRINSDQCEDKNHVVISNNVARKMIFTDFRYDDHHSSISFVAEYNKYVLGMMYKYKVLMEAILELPEEQSLPEESINQRYFACTHVQKLATAVFNYNNYPIGKLNEQYIRHNIVGIESEEEVKFVLAMSNCEKFELESRFHEDHEYSPPRGYWIIYTKVFFPNVKGDDNNEMYAFGWNKTEYPKPENYNINWPYEHKDVNNKKRKLDDDKFDDDKDDDE